jgi:putative membrane protein
MSSEVQAFADGFPTTLLHAGVTLALLIVGCTLYVLLSRRKVISRISEGNSAAAVSFGGVIMGLAIPLAMSLHASTTLVEITIWGAATIVVQLLAYVLVDLLLSGLPQRVDDGDVAAAVLLVGAKLAVAVVLAAAVAG